MIDLKFPVKRQYKNCSGKLSADGDPVTEDGDKTPFYWGEIKTLASLTVFAILVFVITKR